MMRALCEERAGFRDGGGDHDRRATYSFRSGVPRREWIPNDIVEYGVRPTWTRKVKNYWQYAVIVELDQNEVSGGSPSGAKLGKLAYTTEGSEADLVPDVVSHSDAGVYPSGGNPLHPQVITVCPSTWKGETSAFANSAGGVRSFLPRLAKTASVSSIRRVTELCGQG